MLESAVEKKPVHRIVHIDVGSFERSVLRTTVVKLAGAGVYMRSDCVVLGGVCVFLFMRFFTGHAHELV